MPRINYAPINTTAINYQPYVVPSPVGALLLIVDDRGNLLRWSGISNFYIRL